MRNMLKNMGPWKKNAFNDMTEGKKVQIANKPSPNRQIGTYRIDNNPHLPKNSEESRLLNIELDQ